MGLGHFVLQPLWKLLLTPLFLTGLRADFALAYCFYRPCILFYFASYDGYWLFWSTSVISVLPSSSNNCIVCAQSPCLFITLALCFLLQVMAVIDCFGALLCFWCYLQAATIALYAHNLLVVLPPLHFVSIASSGDYWLFWSTSMILVLPLSSNNCVVCARPSYHMYMFPVIFHLWCLLTDHYWFSL